MAEATPSGEPPAKRAKVVEPDWTAEFAEAKAKYNTAGQKLEEELEKDPQQRDQQRIEFLQKAMQNAQKDKELLLQKQSQPSEAQQGPKYPDFPQLISSPRYLFLGGLCA